MMLSNLIVTDKIDRYQSHKNFLLECIREKVIPMGLRINLTPTIGNNSPCHAEGLFNLNGFFKFQII